jgi:hypothetical protein
MKNIIPKKLKIELTKQSNKLKSKAQKIDDLLERFSTNRTNGNKNKLTHKQTIYKALKKAKKPLSLVQLLERLNTNGNTISYPNLATCLSMNDDFKNVERGRFRKSGAWSLNNRKNKLTSVK